MKLFPKKVTLKQKNDRISLFFINSRRSIEPQKKRDEINEYTILNKKEAHIFNNEILQKIIKIFKNPSELRSEAELKFSYKILKKEKFFRELRWKFSDDILKSLLYEFRLEYFQKFKIIVHYGDIIRKLFFLLEGEIYVLQPKNADKKITETNKKIQILDGAEYTNNRKVIKYYKDEEVLTKYFPDFKISKIYYKSDIIGSLEKSYVSHEILVIKENTVCIYAIQEFFQKIIKKKKNISIQKNLTFFNEIPLFSEIPYYILDDIMKHCNIKTYFAGKEIFSFGEPSQYFYLIKEGEIEIRENIQIYKKNEDLISQTDLSSFEEAQKLSKDLQTLEKSVMNKIYNEKNELKNLHKFSIYVLGKKQFFGETEIFESSFFNDIDNFLNYDLSPKKTHNVRKEFLKLIENLTKKPRNTQAKAISESIIYEISSQKFLEIYLNHFHSTKTLKGLYFLRNKWREKRKNFLTEHKKENIHSFYELTHKNINIESNPLKNKKNILENEFAKKLSLQIPIYKEKEISQRKSRYNLNQRFSMNISHFKVPDLSLEGNLINTIRNKSSNSLLFDGENILLDNRTNSIFNILPNKSTNGPIIYKKHSFSGFSINKSKFSEKKLKSNHIKRPLSWNPSFSYDVGTKSKSEERTKRINNHKIQQMIEKTIDKTEKKLKNKSYIEEIIQNSDRKQIKKIILMKRVKIDKILKDNQNKEEIIFTKRKTKFKKNRPTSFQKYTEDKNWNKICL